MKKYLIKGLLALVVGGFVASCADDKVDYIPISQQKATAYEDAFKELIGGEVAPNHNWGFKKTSLVDAPATTRVAATNSNQWFDGVTEQFKHLVKPADVTDREEQVVSDWFKANQHPTSDPIYLSEFFVQQVYFGTKPYTETGNNNTEYTVVGGEHMDYLYAWDPTNNQLDHINNFNTSDPKRNDPDNQNGFHNMQLMQNSSTATFGFHESYNSDNQRYYSVKDKNWVIKALYVDGVLGYYVGFDYESHGDQGEFEPDGFFDDRIVKIVPGNGVYTYTPNSSSSSSSSTRTDRVERRRLVNQGRIFCEDLGTNIVTTSDIDFNDAVFDAKIWRKGQFNVEFLNDTYNSESDYLEGIYQDGINATGIDYNVTTEDVIVNGKFKYVAEICILAAGGTVPLRIGGTGTGNFEIHDKFGVGHTTIVNTMGAPSQQQFTTNVQTATCEHKTIEVDITNYVKAKLEAGITEIGLETIPIEVQWVGQEGQTVGELNANYNEAPQKLCVPIGTPWAYERIKITDAYKDFANYATNYTPENNLTFWASDNNIDPDMLYSSNSEGLTPETGETGNVNSNPYHDEVVDHGTTTTTTVTETVLWEGTNSYSADGGNGTEMSLYSIDFSNNGNKYVRVYATINTSNPGNVEFQIKEDPSWNTIMTFVASDYNSEGQYFQKAVDSTFVDNLTSTIHSWGRDCTITKICKVVVTSSTGE